MSWGATDKSNYPFGEQLGKPQFITSAVFIFAYKLFSSLTTPICGLNLIVLLGYMSTALTMFGLVRWLSRRFDIALFAGYAAAFVPFHLIKSQSHVNYIYGSIFIGVIWAFLWLLSKPSYRRAAVLGVVSALGFYFDGYFILITSLLLLGLFAAPFALDFIKLIINRKAWRDILRKSFVRLRYIIFSAIVLALLLVPILLVFRASGDAISQSLASVRSNIKAETLIYGARPIEFILPPYNNPLLPTEYAGWRAQKLHSSNYSESTLYVGYTVLLLAFIGLAGLSRSKLRREKLKGIPYTDLVFSTTFAWIVCFAFSLPAVAFLFGHDIRMPTLLLIKLTANWRVLSRLFLAMDPLIVLMASLGLYFLTRNKSRLMQIGTVFVCGLLLFLEYLPTPLHTTNDLYKDAPPIYKQLANDDSTKIVAEYPIADFRYTPSIFTFQPMHKKILVNSNDSSISRGPFLASFAGLNDKQTLGTLKSLKVDEVITHGFKSDNSSLAQFFENPNYNPDGTLNLPASSYAYRLGESVNPINSLLVIKKGYVALSVDSNQVSHRIITSNATLYVFHIIPSPATQKYRISFAANSICENPAEVTISQGGQTIWFSSVGKLPASIELTVDDEEFNVQTKLCSIDVSNLSSAPLP